MRVVRSGHFERQVAAELDIEGRPSVRQFEVLIAPIAELVFSAFWDDPTLVPTVDEESGIRITLIAPPAPYMFPPSVFYARQVDAETIEMMGVDFEWDYWDQIGGRPAGLDRFLRRVELGAVVSLGRKAGRCEVRTHVEHVTGASYGRVDATDQRVLRNHDLDVLRRSQSASLPRALCRTQSESRPRWTHVGRGSTAEGSKTGYGVGRTPPRRARRLLGAVGQP